MNSTLPQHLQRSLLSDNQQYKYCDRQSLLKVQNEVQARALRQQLISSAVMKQYSLKKLIQEQDLLIYYLKQELQELNLALANSAKLQANLTQLERRYLSLIQEKKNDILKNQQQLIRYKAQYNDLHLLLRQLGAQSSTLYELRLKLSERNKITKKALEEQVKEYCEIKLSVEHEAQVNCARKCQNQQLQKENQTLNNNNSLLTQTITTQTNQLNDNKNKLDQLQKMVLHYEEEQRKLKLIEKAALKDNTVLKQTLKLKISSMKDAQQQLEALKTQKAGLENEKMRQTQNLQAQRKINQQAQDSHLNQIHLSHQYKEEYQQLLKQKYLAENQLQQLEHTKQTLVNRKQQSLQINRQAQQKLQRNLYFIDQYLIINSQLVNQIGILLHEDIRKSALTTNFTNPLKNRSNQIIHLKDFLDTAQTQIHQIKRNTEVLASAFDSYKLF